MRLTYFLAAIAATLAELIVDALMRLSFMAASGAEAGTYGVGTAGEWAFMIGAIFFGNLIFLGIAWAVLGAVVPAFRAVKLPVFVGRGVLANAVVSSLMVLTLVPFVGLGIESFADGIVPVVRVLLAGAVWGYVFWMRAPKSAVEVAA